jgi:hypothetical protein
MEYLPAELRVQSGENVDEWGRHHTHSPASFAQDSPHRNKTLDAASPGSLSSRRGKKGKSRKMITFDLAELFPRCKGLNINFTSPLTPTAAELQAAVQAVQVRWCYVILFGRYILAPVQYQLAACTAKC